MHPYIGPVILDLLSPGVEIGLVTTNVDAMVTFYEGFLGLEPQGQIDFADGTQRRYTLGGSVLKLVTYTTPPPLPVAAGGGRAQAGLRYVTIGVRNLRDLAAKVEAAGYDVVEPRRTGRRGGGGHAGPSRGHARRTHRPRPGRRGPCLTWRRGPR